MTRKAHNVDRQRTEEAHFADARSYITHDGHEFLFGLDVSWRREQVFTRDKGICQVCGKYYGEQFGHMHHRQGGTVGRCDCLHNLAWLCPTCHLKQHVHVMSGKVG